MAPFKLWLHSVHGSAVPHVSPLHIKEVGLCDLAEDRISCLADAVCAAGTLHHQTVNGSVEVSLTAGGLYMLGEHGEESVWLPLGSSTIVRYESVHTRSLEALGNAAGLLAYSMPVAQEAFSWGTTGNTPKTTQPDSSEHVWILVVTSTTSSNIAGNIDVQSSILQLAMEELGAQGAIRGDMVGLRSLRVSLGEGASASVQLLQRESSAVVDQPRSRAPLAGRMRTTRFGTLGANSSVLAAKVMTSESASEQVFAEASYLIAVRGHPNVVRFFGTFCLTPEGNEASWVLMTEAHEGGSIQSHIRQNDGLPTGRALKYTMELLQALAHIHSFALIHRDVKSDNVILSAADHAVLIDFGIAAHTSQHERLASRCGTPGCVAPEFLSMGDCNVKGDVFGAGIVMYEALSGFRPFNRESQAKTLRANTKAKVSYDLECFRGHRCNVTGVLRMMLRALPQQRFTSAIALDAVSRLLAIREAAEVQAVPDADADADAHIEAPPEPTAQRIVEAGVQAPLGIQELQRRSSAPHARRRLPVHDPARALDEEQSMLPESAETSGVPCQKDEMQDSHTIPGTDSQDRHADMPSSGILDTPTPFPPPDQKTCPSVPRTEPPVMDPSREYRKKCFLANGEELQTPHGRLTIQQPSASASSFVRPSEPASKSTSSS